jgi:hypothetical protein
MKTGPTSNVHDQTQAQINSGTECFVISSFYPALWEWLEVPHRMLDDETIGQDAIPSKRKTLNIARKVFLRR